MAAQGELWQLQQQIQGEIFLVKHPKLPTHRGTNKHWGLWR